MKVFKKISTYDLRKDHAEFSLYHNFCPLAIPKLIRLKTKESVPRAQNIKGLFYEASQY